MSRDFANDSSTSSTAHPTLGALQYLTTRTTTTTTQISPRFPASAQGRCSKCRQINPPSATGQQSAVHKTPDDDDDDDDDNEQAEWWTRNGTDEIICFPNRTFRWLSGTMIHHGKGISPRRKREDRTVQ
ncbi:hypothetical protein ZHAS_00014602 [Anopheles sinensis]|uniref:Uncharacterized protein n=1 Tax=Anopheles sinensis TaxID=74873 RepID=A0A084W8M1_ANOSI|nr:hypothetical protein ZHAS_00014602 [Anopheles sinensis]